jgi:hypothetical protein
MKLVVVSNLTEFFKAELDKVKTSQSEEVKFYLVNLLTRFSNSSNLFEDSNGSNRIPTTIELLAEAEAEDNLELKKLLYCQAGDLSLYSIGFIKSQGISDYYYEFIGKKAYSCVVEHSTRSQKDLYRELSSDFSKISKSLKTLSDSLKINSY